MAILPTTRSAPRGLDGSAFGRSDLRVASEGDERRERERPRVWLPVRVIVDDRELYAVTYDASDRGMLLLTAAPLDVGARVSLRVELPGDPPKEHTAAGRVLRTGKNDRDPEGLWPHRAAIALDAPIPGLQEELERLARVYPPPGG
jgi:hypothetical protein